MSDSDSLPEIFPVSKGNDGKNFGVIIPCSTEDFGDFVSGLLGQPQTILTSVEGAFVVDRNNVENIYDLVQQRVLQQNNSSLIQWTITLLYDDNSSVRLDSLEEFKRYAEVKKHISIGFNIHFTYLVRFTGKKTPEKQSIDISFSIGNRRAYLIASSLMPYEAGFTIRIQHTARSWGVDLESLLVGHLSTLRKLAGSKFRQFLSKNSIRVEPFLAFLFLTSAIAGLLLQSHFSGRVAASKVVTYLAGLSPERKIAEVAQIITSQFDGGLLQQNIVLILLFTVIFSMFSMALADAIERRISQAQRGALLLTAEAARVFEKSQKSERRFWMESLAGIFVGIFSGVIANYIFAWLTISGAH